MIKRVKKVEVFVDLAFYWLGEVQKSCMDRVCDEDDDENTDTPEHHHDLGHGSKYSKQDTYFVETESTVEDVHQIHHRNEHLAHI